MQKKQTRRHPTQARGSSFDNITTATNAARLTGRGAAKESSMAIEYIFVYGTLRKALATPMHDLLARHCHYVGEGAMTGRLYDLGDYPGAIESAHRDERVYGELYRLADPQLLALLDDYEGCTPAHAEPREYVRKAIPVILHEAPPVTAWVYLFNRDVAGLLRIGSGDYVDFIHSAHTSKAYSDESF
ncbi:gamma-glutamylcyclotransferase [Mariprofundus erugo]|uniref:gamma-glutamylcyclotransferase family protein n=1 Tax=Mariprofundus erugo TaxID=2528639 RepID=UPI0010FD9616|nr:gamma-glutamylcyclotransferase family protein [Mariprofundus erugo]TLS77087.1 gamma-glutamylcyclotransferase [Mariprofundus erugo]